MPHVIPAPAPVAIPVAGGDSFPVRRVFCVGRNYADHAREMGVDPGKEPPTFFMKPADALVTEGADMPYPPGTSELHFELELVFAIEKGGINIAAEEAIGHVWGYAAGLDMTRRDLQAAAKKAGTPWDMAKGFDFSAPIGLLAPVAAIGHPTTGALTLTVDGTVRQSADIGDMIWGVPQIIAHLSRLVRLAPGDLVFTGTPAGVGAVTRGQTMTGFIDRVGTVSTRVT